MRKLMAVACCAMLALAACGGGDEDIADQLIDDAEDEGIDLDEDCVRREAARLSEDDAEALRDDDTPSLSPEGQTVLIDLLGCVNDEEFNQSIEDEIMAQLPENVDADCVLEAAGDLEAADFADPANSEKVAEAIAECVDDG